MANHEIVEGSWGIDPVPPRLRVLDGLETGLLWGNLGVSLLVIVAGAVLVPALSLPCGLDANRLPIGLQIAAPPGADALCLRIGDAYQRRTDHHRLAPPLVEELEAGRTPVLPEMKAARVGRSFHYAATKEEG